MPALIRPMLATPGELPPARQEERWAFEMKWDGVRAVVYLEDGGPGAHPQRPGGGVDVPRTEPGWRRPARGSGWSWTARSWRSTRRAPELRRAAGAHARATAVRRALLADVPVHLPGLRRAAPRRPIAAAHAYVERRALLEDLELDGRALGDPAGLRRGRRGRAGRSRGAGARGGAGEAARLASTSRAGARGAGSRSSTCACRRWSSAAGSPARAGARAGSARCCSASPTTTGARVRRPRRHRLHRRDARRAGRGSAAANGKTSPFADERAACAGARTRRGSRRALVGEVAFGEWTRDGRMRHPVWRGLRPDKAVEEVVREGDDTTVDACATLVPSSWSPGSPWPGCWRAAGSSMPARTTTSFRRSSHRRR